MGKPPETTHFYRRWRRPATWGFANSTQATRVSSLTIVAGGLHAKGRLSFKTGVFGAIEPPKAVRRALWDKNKNSIRKKFLELPQFLSPKPTKRDMVSPGGTRLETAPKTGRNWSGGMAEPTSSNGNNRNTCNIRTRQPRQHPWRTASWVLSLRKAAGRGALQQPSRGCILLIGQKYSKYAILSAWLKSTTYTRR